MSEDINPRPVQPVNDNAGSLTVDDGGGSLTVDGTVGISGTVTTTGGGGTEYAEDAAHSNGDAGKLILAVRRDTGAAFTSTDGDYTAIAADSNGRVKVVHDQALPAGANVIGTVTIQDGGNVISIDDAGGSLTVDGPLTDTQLRATPVPVSGTVTANAGSGPYPVSDNGGSLTVDGTVTANAGSGPWPVTDNGGSLTVDGSVTADTELPAAAALADGTSNPTAPAVGAFGHLWNGTGWDRVKGDTTSGVWVNVKNTSLAVTGTFWQATQPVSLATLPALTAGTAAIGKLAANDGVDIGDVTINNASLAVTGTFWQATQPVSLTSLPGQYAEDAGHTNGDTGTLLLGVRRDTAAAFTSTDGDYSALAMDSNGRAKVYNDLQLPSALGQQTMANSLGIVIASNQTAIPITDNSGSLTVDAPVGTPLATRLSDGTSFLTTASGRLSVDASGVAVPITDNAGSLTVDQPTGTNLHTVVDSGSVTASQGGAPWSENLTQVAGNAISTTGVNGQAKVGIADSLGNSMNSAGSGFLKVTDEPRQLFYDNFDSYIDTTNMWVTGTGNSGVTASTTTGVMTLGTGTTANGYSKLTSIPSFKPTIPGWIVFSDAIAIPDAAAPTANALRFWGQASLPTTPTTTSPVTDGYGYELGTDGKLRAVVYAGGSRTVIQDLSTSGSSRQPTDTGYHRYVTQIRTDKVYYYIDTIDSAGLVATTSFNSSQAQILPKAFLAVGAGTPPVSNTQIQCTGAVVSDTGKNHTQLADGAYPWRKATISSAGRLAVDANVTGFDGSQTLSATVVQRASGNALYTNDHRTHRLLGQLLLEQIKTNRLLEELINS